MKKFLKICISIALLSVYSFSPIAKATDVSQCDYDNFILGYGEIKINGDQYTLSFDDEMNGYTFTGLASNPLVPQLQEALTNAKPDPETGMQNILLLTSMDKPVCATTYNNASLYIQPGMTEKATYHVVGVCIPETSDCWSMKVMKYSPAASHIKNGSLDLEGKIASVIYTDDATIMSWYEDTNYDY